MPATRFAFASAPLTLRREDFSDYEDELEDGSEDVAVELVDVADDSLEAVDAVDAIDGTDDAAAAEDVETPERVSHVAARWNRIA